MPNGYAQFYLQGGMRLAHRVAWVIAYGVWPSELDHKCEVRHCVNINCLRELDHRSNVLRGNAPTAINARKTQCPKGHRYEGENFRVTREGRRICRVCDRERKRK